MMWEVSAFQKVSLCSRRWANDGEYRMNVSSEQYELSFDMQTIQ